MSNQSWRKRSMSSPDIPGDLPINNPASAVARKESSTSAMARKLLHLIPVVVTLCFIILYCFGSTVDSGTKFEVSIKKLQLEVEENDGIDVTVKALESPPADDFLTADAPFSPLPLPDHPKVSLLEIHDQKDSLTDSYLVNATLVSHDSVSVEPSASVSDSRDHSDLLADSQEPKTLVSRDAELLFLDSDEPRIMYPDTIKAPPPDKES